LTTVLEGLDWIVLGIYFLALILVAVWVVLQKNKNTEDYFLAGRNVGWFVIGASIFASNIGSEHVVGLAGTGFESGAPMAHYELHAWIVLLLGWLFLPFLLGVELLQCLNFWRKDLIQNQDGFYLFFP
jgi:SSS family solute:Na+ symporter